MLLYIHIPFCHRICPYCSFYKHTPGKTPIGRFIEALGREAAQRISRQPRTLYLGGGTPSMLSLGHLEKLFGALHQQMDFSQLDEVTLEANPATFDDKKAALFRELGVTRVSLGIQSFNASVLRTLGREHDPAEAAESVKILREAGLAEVNIDLMFSIPGLKDEDWRETLEQSIALKPDHISAYNLTYEEDTAFFESLKRGEMDMNEDRDAHQFHLADELLSAAGFGHYETSNYARPGRESTHNRGYWQGEDYLGLGPSAVSTMNRERSRNVADTALYVKRINTIGNAVDDSEQLDEEQWRIERVALGLRTLEGISLDLLDEAGRDRAASLANEGMAALEGERLKLKGIGRALVDPIVAELI